MKNINKLLLLTSLSTAACASFAMASTPSAIYNDEDINYQVAQNINSSSALDGSKIALSTVNGHVKLAGELPSNFHYSEAVSIASNIKGVKDIDTSDLQVVKSDSYLSDVAITGKIKGILAKNKLVYPNQPSPYYVNVETNNKNVYLSGRVKDKHQASKAIDAAYSVPGVKNVVSYLKIKDIRSPVKA